MGFISSLTPPHDSSGPAICFAFSGDRLLFLKTNDQLRIPQVDNLRTLELVPDHQPYLGTLNGIPCYTTLLDKERTVGENMSLISLFEAVSLLDHQTFRAAITAIQIIRWDQNFRYCGRCGTPTVTQTTERAKRCPKCGLMNFPRLSPAIMIAVLKEDSILLANGVNFPNNMYSVLAGFVEPGETLEECAVREVKEEVGLTIGDLKYFSSQPWPFPDSLMIAFTASYIGGRIRVDGKEIRKAGWFKSGELPFRPQANISIAGRLIDWFEKNYS